MTPLRDRGTHTVGKRNILRTMLWLWRFLESGEHLDSHTNTTKQPYKHKHIQAVDELILGNCFSAVVIILISWNLEREEADTLSSWLFETYWPGGEIIRNCFIYNYPPIKEIGLIRFSSHTCVLNESLGVIIDSGYPHRYLTNDHLISSTNMRPLMWYIILNKKSPIHQRIDFFSPYF